MLFITKAPTGIAAIFTATIVVPVPSSGNVPAIARNEGRMFPSVVRIASNLSKLLFQGGFPLAVHGVLTHNGDNLKRIQNERKCFFKFILSGAN